MSEILLGAMRDDIANGRALVIVGTGVTIAATQGAAIASWPGLIRSGVAHALSVDPGLPATWEQGVLADLAMGENDNYLPGMISAAEKVAIALGGATGGEFRAWLRDSFESLAAVDGALPAAITSLGLPVATTNYDDILESSSGLRPVTWVDYSAVQQVLQERDRAIVHLHGHWRSPESVVLGGTSYAGVIGNAAAQALQQSMAIMRSIVFIGVGDGVADPNFAALRKWLTDVFAGTESRHYRLCTSGELAHLGEVHAQEPIVPVAYGDDHSDLTGFLEDLRPGGQLFAVSEGRVTRHLAQDRALEAMCDNVRAQAVLAEHLSGLEGLDLPDMLIPPVLLPVTHEQFVHSNADPDAGERTFRSDPTAEAEADGCVVIASEEGCGLTSALQWMVAAGAKSRSGVVPVVVDFRRLGKGHRPLEREVRRELMMAGALASPKDSLPACAVAIDNVSVRPTRIFERMVDEIRTAGFPLLCIGCRQGAEAEVCDSLEAAELRPTLRYIGRLNQRDIGKMVALVEPARVDTLTHSIVDVANREHLSRTPFTVGLLLSVLLHGESLLGTASETALIDAYVSLLLGRGDPHDDARFALDSVERADILSNIAESFVAQKTGSLTESDVLAGLATYFEELGWTEDPMAVLDNLIRRHVLVIRGGQVKFTQHTFLHLFAAKRAMVDSSFREKLLGDPLFYAPILRHYAALTRNDAEALEIVASLLWAPDAVPAVTAGSPFSGETEVASIGDAGSVDELVQQLALFRGASDEEDEQPSDDEPEDFDDWLDHYEDSDDHLSPFPIDDLAEAPAEVKIMSALALVSSVLRDSELVKDVELKRRVLHRTLIVWGRFVELITTDEDMMEFFTALGNALADAMQLTKSVRDRFLGRFERNAPLIMAYGGLSTTLSSRKLLRSLDACFKDELFLSEPRAAVMGALLAFDIQIAGWTQYLEKAEKRHGGCPAMRYPMRQIELMAYRRQHLSNQDEARLHDLLVGQMCREVGIDESPDGKASRERVSQELKKGRMIRARSRLAAGETVFSDALEVSSEEVPPTS